VPPSRFQKCKGSIYAVPGTRDGRIEGNHAARFHQKLAELESGNRGFLLKKEKFQEEPIRLAPWGKRTRGSF
jgi:hypothetical protein